MFYSHVGRKKAKKLQGISLMYRRPKSYFLIKHTFLNDEIKSMLKSAYFWDRMIVIN